MEKASWLSLTPDQLKAGVQVPYQSYLRDLHERWLAAQHPDVDNRGRPRQRAAALDDEARAALMVERIGPAARRVRPDAWHAHCSSPRSSQALLVEVLGNLAEEGSLDLILPGFRDTQICFEEIHGRTNFDAVVRDSSGEVIATVEGKFAEEGFNHCDYPSTRCDGSWWARPATKIGCPMAQANPTIGDRYWTAAFAFLGQPAQPPTAPVTCPLWAGYQFVHNLAETTRLSTRAEWILLYDSRNPYFGDSRFGWVSRIQAADAPVRAVSWQELISAALPRRPRLQRLRVLHGL